MACRLASVPVLTVSVLKRLQDLDANLFLLRFKSCLLGNFVTMKIIQGITAAIAFRQTTLPC
jgi:hypothetical protein